MAFFRKWKIHYKHKKLSEEWALASSMKDLSENDETVDNNGEDGSSDAIVTKTFDLKYLGSTSIETEKSQKSTADAIKSVISLTKTARRKTQRVNLIVSPQGIDVVNPANGENLLHVSIYKISYCSADAAHDHVFAFVGSSEGKDNKNDAENLSCHVFHCPKRKIAHDVTLTVAKSFENAYEIWREMIQKKMHKDEIKKTYENNSKIIGVDANSNSSNDSVQEDTNLNNDLRDLLDFTPEDMSNHLYDKDNRGYLQNTWVSFEDDNSQMTGNQRINELLAF